MNVLRLKQTWAPLVAAAGWLAALTSSFLTFPVQLSIDSRQDLLIRGFTQFVVAALFGILSAARINTRGGWDRKRILRWAMGLLLGFIVLFLAYVPLYSEWTCFFANRFTVVIGSQPSPDALAYMKLHPHISSCNALIAEYGGDTTMVYGRTNLLTRYMVLATVYTLLWVVAAGLVFAVARAIAEPKPSRRR